MTGFGSAAVTAGDVTGSLELRSVNSRHLKLNFRLPYGAEGFEEPLRAVVGDRLRRGHVDVTLRLTPSQDAAGRIEISYSGGEDLRRIAMALLNGPKV